MAEMRGSRIAATREIWRQAVHHWIEQGQTQEEELGENEHLRAAWLQAFDELVETGEQWVGRAQKLAPLQKLAAEWKEELKLLPAIRSNVVARLETSKDRSCARLTIESNGCKLARCLRALRGQPSDSASPTDTWTLEFRPGTTYKGQEEGKERSLDSAFVKLWIAPNDALDYELEVYRLIRRVIQRTRLSPHFLELLYAGNACEFDDLWQMLVYGAGLSPAQAASNLVRNLEYLRRRKPNRPSITWDDAKAKELTRRQEDQGEGGRGTKRVRSAGALEQWAKAQKGKLKEALNSKQKQRAFSDFQKARFNLLVTELVPAGTETFRTWFKEHGRTPQGPIVLWQYLSAAYVMGLVPLIQGDAHDKNAFVSPTPLVPARAYRYNDQWYYVQSPWTLMVYDFDHAFAPQLPMRHHRWDKMGIAFRPGVATLPTRIDAYEFLHFVAMSTTGATIVRDLIRSVPGVSPTALQTFDRLRTPTADYPREDPIRLWHHPYNPREWEDLPDVPDLLSTLGSKLGLLVSEADIPPDVPRFGELS